MNLFGVVPAAVVSVFAAPSMNALVSNTTSTADITTFTTLATSVVTWLVTTFGTILGFMLANPICFLGLICSLVIMAIGTLRHIIGG